MTTLRRQRNHTLAILIAFASLGLLNTSATAAGLCAMNESDLASVSARGLTDDLLHHDSAQAGGNKVIGKLTSSLDKSLNFFEVETTLTDVAYDPARAKTFLNADGSITQILPKSIGEISFENIHVKGAAPGAGFGSISIKAIDFTGTTLTLAPRH